MKQETLTSKLSWRMTNKARNENEMLMWRLLIVTRSSPPMNHPLITHAPASYKVQLGAMGPFDGDARLNSAANLIAGY